MYIRTVTDLESFRAVILTCLDGQYNSNKLSETEVDEDDDINDQRE